MTLSDVVVHILIERQQYENRSIAADVVLQTFRKEFPYWAYSDWNVEVPVSLAKILVQHFSNSATPISEMILELPPLVDRLRLIRH